MMLLLLVLLMIPFIGLISFTPRVGSPVLLRRRRRALHLDIVAAELGVRSSRRRPPAVERELDAAISGEGLVMMFMTLMLWRVMAVLEVRRCGLCRGSGRPHGYTYLIKPAVSIIWQLLQELEMLAMRRGGRDCC
jgi:hypothetical protein